MLNIRFFARKHFSPFQYAQKQHVQNFFGSRQHGLPQLALADLSGDLRLLQEAQAAARSLLQSDPGLTRPENRPVLERVRRLFADTPDIFN